MVVLLWTRTKRGKDAELHKSRQPVVQRITIDRSGGGMPYHQSDGRRGTRDEIGPIYIRDRGEELRGLRTMIDHKGRHRAAVLVGRVEDREKEPASKQLTTRGGGTARIRGGNTLSEELGGSEGIWF
ncbi:uncharacterized protein PGTG_17775 [Puccinia graminis f. sp. tritici CRL 75-36-700-3]|uniref:Uncharacterized protein n=1 Tax=Puccinia graminis f. sp. tritici (strain CRL 75-36-700-3 / race SCCL) TaxID=418459 RepID=E3L5F0_PUCGT|nr:uncharacterized protein PGTG_17775 [Puccinia graminis f. sp. tritici CRL 75-36-700-3]EFP91775.1 hypothetical protein PGTG_17775 [Puccinia graminis f. sp. tritici CRL 75-36-700-3]